MTEEDKGTDQSIPDTVPPEASHHGFLEQFEAFSHSHFEGLKEVVEAGLQNAERVMLVKVALKLFALAVHNAKDADFTLEQKQEVEAFVLELETTLHLSS